MTGVMGQTIEIEDDGEVYTYPENLFGPADKAHFARPPEAATP